MSSCLGTVLSAVGWALWHQLEVKKRPHRHAAAQSDGGSLSAEVPSLTYVKLTTKASRWSHVGVVYVRALMFMDVMRGWL